MTRGLKPGEEAAADVPEAEPRIARTTERPAAAREEATPRTTGPQRWGFSIAVGVLIVGLLATGALAWVSYSLYDRNENRLLDLRGRELGLVLTEAAPNVQTPLASAAALAEATNGNAQKFMHFAGPSAGASPGHQFVSMSLWRLSAPQRGPIAVVGVPPALSPSSPVTKAFFARAAHTAKFSVVGLPAPPRPRLGYAVTTPSPAGRFVVYGESLLPADRRSRLQSSAAFSELNYALYLGRSERAADLLVTSLTHLPIRGRQSKDVVPFGDSVLTLVVSARAPLAGSFPEQLPWIVTIVGAILTLAAAAMTVRLIRGRRSAEDLAGRLELALDENRRLYAEQRNIAQTLQHALLPDQLPKIPGAEASARFEAGERGVEIGGDWYDVIPIDEQRVLIVVGDVTGRGLRAAATMASLRYAIHAYAAQGDPPAMILTKLSKLLHVAVGGQLATVLCALVDVGAREVTVTSAGHLPPLLIADGHAEYIEGDVGPPIGVQDGATYTSTTVHVPPAATFLAFTDGLVERRNETLDRGLERLREAARSNHLGLTELLDTLAAELRHEPSEDDTAIVGLRWTR